MTKRPAEHICTTPEDNHESPPSKKPCWKDSSDPQFEQLCLQENLESDENIGDNMSSIGFAKHRASWCGLHRIKTLVVFGDSSTRYGSTKTWLIHLLEKINSQREKEDLPSISAYNYANPGDTVEDDLSDQLTRFFDRFPKKSSPQDQPILDPSETCYVFWLGINDCGRTMEEDLEEITNTLIEDGIEELYTKASARNFLIFDVPPKDRSPGGLEMPDLANRISTWNTHLKDLTTKFVEESTLASLFLFSTNQVVTEILDNPTTYDFQEDDVDQEGGGIWMDELHFTSEVHTIIADKLHQALSKFDSTSRISDS